MGKGTRDRGGWTLASVSPKKAKLIQYSKNLYFKKSFGGGGGLERFSVARSDEGKKTKKKRKKIFRFIYLAFHYFVYFLATNLY